MPSDLEVVAAGCPVSVPVSGKKPASRAETRSFETRAEVTNNVKQYAVYSGKNCLVLSYPYFLHVWIPVW